MRVAYAPQSAWIQNGTVRQNVLFVNPMDKRKYDSVIRNCCLKPDLKQLPGEDLTEIGEKVRDQSKQFISVPGQEKFAAWPVFKHTKFLEYPALAALPLRKIAGIRMIELSLISG